MTAKLKGVTILLMVLFFGVGLAALHQGLLIFGNFTAQSRGKDPQIPPAGAGEAAGWQFITDPTRTPLMPIQATPSKTPEATSIPDEDKEDLSLDKALRMGWTTITVDTPWGSQMIFSFQPVLVDFQQPDFARLCPFDEQNACFISQDGGVYILAHSEYPGAVAEQARSVVEGTLFPLETIQRNVISLINSKAVILQADGNLLMAKVSAFTRTTGVANIYNLAANREIQPGNLIIEFCGLPHAGDGADSAGTTGSVYVLTLTKED